MVRGPPSLPSQFVRSKCTRWFLEIPCGQIRWFRKTSAYPRQDDVNFPRDFKSPVTADTDRFRPVSPVNLVPLTSHVDKYGNRRSGIKGRKLDRTDRETVGNGVALRPCRVGGTRKLPEESPRHERRTGEIVKLVGLRGLIDLNCSVCLSHDYKRIQYLVCSTVISFFLEGAGRGG